MGDNSWQFVTRKKYNSKSISEGYTSEDQVRYRSKEDDVNRISTSIYVTDFSDSFSAKDLFQTCKQYGKGFKRDEKQRSDDTNDYLDRVYGLHFEGEVKAEHQGHPLAPQPEIPVWKWEGISYGYCEPNILAKVSPWKGVVRFGKKGKLASRFVGPFEIIEKEGP
ncbi:hypothetical protein Tco_0051196 [Tanacetum coccineum]